MSNFYTKSAYKQGRLRLLASFLTLLSAVTLLAFCVYGIYFDESVQFDGPPKCIYFILMAIYAGFVLVLYANFRHTAVNCALSHEAETKNNPINDQCLDDITKQDREVTVREYQETKRES